MLLCNYGSSDVAIPGSLTRDILEDASSWSPAELHARVRVGRHGATQRLSLMHTFVGVIVTDHRVMEIPTS
jgi:hypothetical protein